jgi:hypothetical protein
MARSMTPRGEATPRFKLFVECPVANCKRFENSEEISKDMRAKPSTSARRHLHCLGRREVEHPLRKRATRTYDAKLVSRFPQLIVIWQVNRLRDLPVSNKCKSAPPHRNPLRPLVAVVGRLFRLHLTCGLRRACLTGGSPPN